MHLTSPLLASIPGLRHGFGSASEEVPAPLAPLLETAGAVWNQAHGAHGVELFGPRQQCGDCDALFTFLPEIPAAVRTADCVPILMARRDGRAVAAVHAGWRGTKARILHRVWLKLSAKGENPADWMAAIGPAIGPCCYEVDSEIAADFTEDYPESAREPARPSPRFIDLPGINALQLREIGVAQVDLLRACTMCGREGSQHLYHSWRREKLAEQRKTRQFSVIAIQA